MSQVSDVLTHHPSSSLSSQHHNVLLVLGYFDRGNIGDQAYIQSYLKLFNCDKNNQTKLIFESIDDFDPCTRIRISSLRVPLVLSQDNTKSSIQKPNHQYYFTTEINTDNSGCGSSSSRRSNLHENEQSTWNPLHALIVAGGDVVNDYFMKKIQAIIQKCKCPCYLFSAGIPYTSGCKYLHMFDHVILRSHADVKLAISEIGQSNVTYSPDFTWILHEDNNSRLSLERDEEEEVTRQKNDGNNINNDRDCQRTTSTTTSAIKKYTKKQRICSGLCFPSSSSINPTTTTTNTTNTNPNLNTNASSRSLFGCCFQSSSSLSSTHSNPNHTSSASTTNNNDGITTTIRPQKKLRVLRVGVCLAQPAFYNNINQNKLYHELLEIFYNIASEMTIMKHNNNNHSSNLDHATATAYDQVEFHLISFNISQSMSESDHIVNQTIANMYETSSRYKLDQIKIIPTFIKQQYASFEHFRAGDEIKPQFNSYDSYNDIYFKDADNMHAYFESRPFDFMIGMRYHSILFAMMSKIPFVALYVTKKVQSLMDDFKSSQSSIASILQEDKNYYTSPPFDGYMLPHNDQYQPTEFPIEQISSQTCNIIRRFCVGVVVVGRENNNNTQQSQQRMFPVYLLPIKQIKEIVFNGVRKNVVNTQQVIQFRRLHINNISNIISPNDLLDQSEKDVNAYVEGPLVEKCILHLVSYFENKIFSLSSTNLTISTNTTTASTNTSTTKSPSVLEHTIRQWTLNKLSTRELCIFIYYWKINHGTFVFSPEYTPVQINSPEFQQFEKNVLNGLAVMICFAITNTIASAFVWGFESHLSQHEYPNVKNCIKYIYENTFPKLDDSVKLQPLLDDKTTDSSCTLPPSSLLQINWKSMSQLQVVIDINYIEQDNYKDLHRSGWSYAIEGLQHLDTTHLFRPAEIYVDTCLERTFLWGLDTAKAIQLVPYGKQQQQPQHFQKARWWCGFIHHTFYDRHNPYHCDALLKVPEFIESIRNGSCKALFVLSKSLQLQFENALHKTLLEHGIVVSNIPRVFALEHPMQFVPKMFDWDRVMTTTSQQRTQQNPLRIIQIGAWMRNSFAIYKLPIYNNNKDVSNIIPLQKTHLRGKQMDSYFRPLDAEFVMASKEKQNLLIPDNNNNKDHPHPHLHPHHYSRSTTTTTEKSSTINIDHTQNKYIDGLIQHIDHLHNSVEILSFVSNDAYDQLLSKNIVFLHLYDAAAVNTVLECIVRNTPLIVNRLPALEEVLGCDYPGFYEDTITLHDAAAIAMDRDRLFKIYTHLCTKIDKSRFTIEHFLNAFQDCLAQVMNE
jgi:polysaccharide pyruvyl transferase WcaK-like protein